MLLSCHGDDLWRGGKGFCFIPEEGWFFRDMDSGGLATMTDEEIRNLLLAHPEEGWKPFWDRHGRFISQMIQRYRLHAEDSEEVLQEVSFRLIKDNLRLLRSWDPRRCMLRGYLAVIISSTCRSYLRSLRRRNFKNRFLSQNDPAIASFFMLELPDSGPSPLDLLHRQELTLLLWDCLDSSERSGIVKCRDRLLLEMRLNGANTLQIAQRLGISQGNAAIRYHRLKKVLKERLMQLGLRTEDLVS